ncbi:sigma 54-interacting transcriptional regulator, partial [Sedimentibacter sp.]
MLDKNDCLSKKCIMLSHERSKKYEINYNQIYSNKILSEQELFLKMEENRELILASAPIMNEIYNFVKGSNFFSILTDNEGCILNVIGDEDILSEAFSFKMIPGAYMDEENIGTNAMGTTLKERTPIQVSGKEHFIKVYHRWTCSACPIRDMDGNIIGTLDLTGYSEYVHSHTLGMVVAGAKAIENELIANYYNIELASEKKYHDCLQNSIMMGLIITNYEGTIIKANSFACGLFGYEDYEINQMNIKDIVKDWNDIKKSITEGDKTFQNNVDVYAKRNILELNISAYPVRVNNNETTHILLFLNEVQKKRKMIDKINSGFAIYTFDKIVGEDKNFLNVINYAKKIADSRSNILITGESGTGKELFAQSIHNSSNRSNAPFIAINCGAIPRNLIEAELFGYDEGSFTGAKAKGNPGKFEIADGGTIFLDEIGEMPYDLQTRLLRVIEEGTISRIGSSKVNVVDVRIIAATNKNLIQEVENGTFRKDLFYR